MRNTKNRPPFLLPVSVLVGAVVSCRVPLDLEDRGPSGQQSQGKSVGALVGAADENDPRWHDEVRDIKAVYEQWLRVDDEARWAPQLCRPPAPSRARLSDARNGTPHARKLYTLYAKDPQSYQGKATRMWEVADSDEARRIESMSQVIVKQAWKPDPIEGDPEDVRRSALQPLGPESELDRERWGRSQLRPVRLGDHWYRGNEFAGLFLMFKPEDPELPTDAGWIYATLSADGETVTGAGRMASCMKCHARHEDRLFGLPEFENEPGEGD